MKIIIGSIWHESNAFSPTKTDMVAFREGQLLSGDEIPEFHRDRKTEIGGMLALLDEQSAESVPTISAAALPSGPVTDEAWKFLLDKLMSGIRDAGSVDGILLARQVRLDDYLMKMEQQQLTQRQTQNPRMGMNSRYQQDSRYSPRGGSTGGAQQGNQRTRRRR